MIGRALHGEIERDLHAVLAAGRHETAEIVERAELRMDGVVAALLRRRWHRGLPGSSGPACSALFVPLRLVRPIGWIGVR